jgi:hypothetical protein
MKARLDKYGYGTPNKRRSPRHNKRFRALLKHDGRIHEIRTIDISGHGVLIPRRVPPPVGAAVTLTLVIRGETAEFEGVVRRHTRRLVNGMPTTGVGIEFSSPEYARFVSERITID